MNKHSEISISAWNINGLSHKTMGDKLTNQDFVNSVKHNDFILLTETWLDTATAIPGFKAVSTCTATPKSKSSCRKSGGITLLYKIEYENVVTIVKQTKNYLWCKISKTITSSNNDLYLCGVYIPPENSHYFDCEIFDNLENDIIYFSTKGNIMILGDFNARTSKCVEKETISSMI